MGIIQSKYLGDKIIELIAKIGLCRKFLAHKVHMPYTTLTKIEKVFIIKPSIYVVAKIAMVL